MSFREELRAAMTEKGNKMSYCIFTIYKDNFGHNHTDFFGTFATLADAEAIGNKTERWDGQLCANTYGKIYLSDDVEIFEIKGETHYRPKSEAKPLEYYSAWFLEWVPFEGAFRALLRAMMAERKITVPELSRRSGIPIRTLENWRSASRNGREPDDFTRRGVLNLLRQ